MKIISTINGLAAKYLAPTLVKHFDIHSHNNRHLGEPKLCRDQVGSFGHLYLDLCNLGHINKLIELYCIVLCVTFSPFFSNMACTELVGFR